MAFSYEEKTGDGSTHTYTFTFDYILKAHVKLFYTRDILLNTQASTLVLGTDYNFTANKSIQLIGSTLNSGTTTGQPYNLPNGTKLMIERQTPDSSQISAWQDGSNLTAEALNNADLQNLYVVQETQDRQDLSAAKSETAKTVSETATTNVSTLTASQVNKDGSVAMTGNLQLGTNRITGVGDPSGAQDAATKYYVDARPGVTGNFGSTTLDFNDDTKIKLGDNDEFTIEYGSDHDAKINSTGDIVYETDGQHIFTVEGYRVFDVYKAGSVYYARVRGTLRPYTDDLYDLGSSWWKWRNLYVDGTGYIDTVSADDITGSAIVTSGTSTSDTKVYSAKRCDELFYNLASAEEIQSGETWVAADNKVATTAAIDARIVDLVDDVGGFVPIANETSFPNANPDINNGAGTLVSVPLANNLTSNGSGVISISNGTVGNSTVTINGAANNTTYTQGFGIIVETTTTLNTYTFHRYVPKATEVTTVAGNIANVNTVAGNNSNINTVAGISSSVATVAGDSTAINNLNSNIAAIQNAGNEATNAAGSAAAAASSATAAASSATTASTQATNSASSATASAASASTSSTQAGNSATSATASAASEANALAYRNTTETYKIAAQGFRDATSGIYIQAESGPYNLADNVSSHTAWGDITDTGGNAVFNNETSNTLLTMSKGSSSYDYGAIA